MHVIIAIDPTASTGDAAFFSQTTILEGIPYRMSFQYVQRENCYLLGIGDPAKPTNVVDGIKIVIGKELIYRWGGVGDPWPPGRLVATTTNWDDSPPSLGDLGTRVILNYVTSDDPNANQYRF